MRLSLRPLALAAVLTSLLACNGGDVFPTAPNADPAAATYASALGVNLTTMTKSASGLYQKDLVVGTGRTAVANDSISTHYTGWLVNGQKFDSSRDRNQPFAFKLGVGRVIAGWDEGIQGMRVGGRRQLVIPPQLAYGRSGSGTIPPNSILVFEVELLGTP